MDISVLQKKIEEIEKDNEYKLDLINRYKELQQTSKALDDQLVELSNGGVCEIDINSLLTQPIKNRKSKSNKYHKDALTLSNGEYEIYGYLRVENENKVYGIVIKDKENKFNPRRTVSLGRSAGTITKLLDHDWNNKRDEFSLLYTRGNTKVYETKSPFAKANIIFEKAGTISSIKDVVSLEKETITLEDKSEESEVQNSIS